MTTFESNEELFSFGRMLRAELFGLGKVSLATSLGEVVDSVWTSASEGLGELELEFKRVRKDASDQLSEDTRGALEEAIVEIAAAFGR